jgi:ABC-type transporter Mla subunit MlaD
MTYTEHDGPKTIPELFAYVGNWNRAIYEQQLTFQIQLLKELAKMSEQVTAIVASVAKAVTDLNAAAAALAAEKAAAAQQAADNAALVQANSDLTAALATLEAQLPPPAAT